MRMDIDGLPMVLPVVAIDAIGVGGGSIAWVDAHRVLKVGPDSAGADPGPPPMVPAVAARPLTDCHLFTGILHADRCLAGGCGWIVLGRGGAGGPCSTAQHGRLRCSHATRLGCPACGYCRDGGGDPQGPRAARPGPGRIHLATVRRRGTTHAAMQGTEGDICLVLVPGDAAAFCALGAVTADGRRDLARSVLGLLDASIAKALVRRRLIGGRGTPLPGRRRRPGAVGGPATGGRHALRGPGPRTSRGAVRKAERSGRGEPVRSLPRRARAVVRIPRRKGRHSSRHRAFGDPRPDAAHCVAALPGPSREPCASQASAGLLGNGWTDVPIHDGDSLPEGFTLAGPAIVEQLLQPDRTLSCRQRQCVSRIQ